MSDQIDRTRKDIARVARWSRTRRREAALRLLAAPPLFDIEVAASCNDRCSFCPRTSLVRPQELMTPGIFAVVERFLPDDAVVMFSGLGEPLLNPALPDFVALLKRRGISSCVITNGQLLSLRLVDALQDAGLEQFQVTVRDLASSLPRWERLIANLRALAAARRPGVRCQLNAVLGEDRRPYDERVDRLATKLGFDLFLRRTHSRGGEAGVRRTDRPDDGCGIFATVTMVTAQGAILACSNDPKEQSRLGHVGATRWSDVAVWKEETIRSGAWFEPCNECDDDYRWVILANSGVDVK